MEFIADIVEVKMKKLMSLDKEVRIIMNTGDLQTLELGKIPSDVNVKVKVELINE